MATRFILSPYSGKGVGTAYPEQAEDAQGNRVLAFDAATDETWEWTDLVAPQGWTGTITAVINYKMASATSGAVRFEVLVQAVTPGDAVDLDAGTSFDSTNSNGDTVPGTAGYLDSFSVTLTNNDSSAAGDVLRIRVNRDANGTTGTDDATGDCHVMSIEIRDAA